MQATVKAGRKKEYFSKDSEIVPFIDRHWEGMTTNPRRVTQSWHATVRFCISDYNDNNWLFIYYIVVT